MVRIQLGIGADDAAGAGAWWGSAAPGSQSIGRDAFIAIELTAQDEGATVELPAGMPFIRGNLPQVGMLHFGVETAWPDFRFTVVIVFYPIPPSFIYNIILKIARRNNII